MASFEVDGIVELENDLIAVMDLPDSVADGILNAEADVIAEAQQRAITKMWKGRYSTGTTARAVKKGRVRKKSSGKYITVYPQGSRNRKEKSYRNAEIAFVNEYGKRGQPGRPAIRIANEQAADKAAAAGEKVYNDYLDSKNL